MNDQAGETQNEHTKGRNMMETISSSFSVKAMARPPSLGTIIPARNAPTHDFKLKIR
jgi:hypothetical protein